MTRYMHSFTVIALLLSGASILIDTSFIGEASGVLIIDSTYRISSDTIINDDIRIDTGGELIVDPGVTLTMGVADRKIEVKNGGALTLKGNSTAYCVIKGASTWDAWYGIEAEKDAVITMDRARVMNALFGFRGFSTGGPGSSGRVFINDSQITFNTKGIILEGTGTSGRHDVILRGNMIYALEKGVSLVSGWEGVCIEENIIWGAEYGIELIGLDDIETRGNWITKCKFGIYGYLLDRSEITNNTIDECEIGVLQSLSELIDFNNNSLMCRQKGLLSGWVDQIDIQNNSVNQFGDDKGVGIELTVDSALIANNIVTAHGTSIRMNSSMSIPYEVRDNLLTGAYYSTMVDEDGDGYCDSDLTLDGTLGAVARRCRTCISDPTRTDVRTYVNPLQVSTFGVSYTRYVIDSDDRGYGPQMGIDRVIYFEDPGLFQRPMGLSGDRSGKVMLYTKSGTAAMNVHQTDNVTLENLTVVGGGAGFQIRESDNVKLKNVQVVNRHALNTAGFFVFDSSNVMIEDTYIWNLLSTVFFVRQCDGVEVRNMTVYSCPNNGIEIENSKRLMIDGLVMRYNGGTGIKLHRSSGQFKDLDIEAYHNTVNLYESHGCVFSNSTFDSLLSQPECLRVDDSKDLTLDNCVFPGLFETADHKEVALYGESTGAIFKNCSFKRSLGPGGGNVFGIRHDGNSDGFNAYGCEFANLSYGIFLRDLSSIIYGEKTNDVESCTFRDCEFGVYGEDYGALLSVRDSKFTNMERGIWALKGEHLIVKDCKLSGFTSGIISFNDLSLEGSEITGGRTGVGMTNLLDPDIYMGAIRNIITSVDDECYYLEGIAFEIEGDQLESSGIGLNLTDCGRSVVMNTSFGKGAPLMSRLASDAGSWIDLLNCTGDHHSSMIGSEGCYANWSWPLEVHVIDEVWGPQPSSLVVTDSGGRVVFEAFSSGSFYVPYLTGFSRTYGVWDYGWNDYRLHVDDREVSDEREINMTSWRREIIQLNHYPSIAPGAPDSIAFDEDTEYFGSVASWFGDRDPVMISFIDSSEDLYPSIVDPSLRVSTKKDHNGEGWILLRATDTLGAHVDHNLSVFVNPVNDPPYLVMELPLLETLEDQPVSIDLTHYAFDVDGDVLTWMNGSVENCTLFWEGMDLIIVPDMDFNGVLLIPLILNDATVDIYHTLIVNVTPVNDPPYWTGEDPLEIEVRAGEAFVLDISGYFVDIDTSLEDIRVTSPHPNVTISGRVLTLHYPEDTRNMTQSFVITVSDGEYSFTFTVKVSVVEVPMEHPEWRVEGSRIDIDPATGDWTVTVRATPGAEVWVVIEGVGSFRLDEVSPGNYSVRIPGSNFEEGMIYDYHFSDMENGPEMTGGMFGGSIRQPVVDDEDERPEKWWILPLMALLSLVVLMLIVIALILIRRGAASDEVWDAE